MPAELTAAQKLLAEKGKLEGVAPAGGYHEDDGGGHGQSTALAVQKRGHMERVQTASPMDAYNKLMEFQRANDCIVLMPQTAMADTISPYYCMGITVVELDTTENGGDTYGGGEKETIDFLKGGKRALTKKGIQKLAQAAGIIWDMVNSKRMDDRSRPDYCEWRAIGGIRNADGTMNWVPKTRVTDLQEILKGRPAKEIWEDGPNGKRRPTGKYREATISASERQFMVAMTETKAMLAVVRDLLSIKQAYTQAELAKKFVVPRMQFCPDYNDPRVREWAMASAMGASVQLYGGNQAALPAAAEAEEALAEMRGETTAPTMQPGDIVHEELTGLPGLDDIQEADATFEAHDQTPAASAPPQATAPAAPAPTAAPPAPEPSKKQPDPAMVEMQQTFLRRIGEAHSVRELQAVGKDAVPYEKKMGAELWKPVKDFYTQREDEIRKANPV